MSVHVRNIFIDLFLTVLTLSLYNLWVQARQMDAVNDMIRQEKYSFVKWLIFSFFTFGMYHIYHEYIKSKDIERACGRNDSMMPFISIILTAFALSFVADAIQQAEINRYYGDDSL